MKVLTRFVARAERARVREMEAQLDRLTKSVDDFYALLGPRNWVYHGDTSRSWRASPAPSLPVR
jgi:hypothetical protein